MATVQPTPVPSKVDEGFEDAAVKDPRHPLYLGEWEKSIPGVHKDIAVDDMDEPHIKRRHTILKAHPEIKNLYGIETSTKYLSVLIVAGHIATAYVFGKILTDYNITMVLAAYFLGGTFTQMIGVVIHECCHCLCFKKLIHNRLLAYFVNIGIPFPIAASFRRYHLEHHTFQGVNEIDPDLPMSWEWKVVKGSRLLKAMWLFCYPLLYVVRGLAQTKKPQKWEVINWIWTIFTDYLIYQYCGARGLFYVVLSLWFGYGIHPAAAHFIQEHYTFVDGQETYSYYGSLNVPFMNIGYHNEHHDFTKVSFPPSETSNRQFDIAIY
ncbi:fatty acid desaturase-domain-containing protein [Paraphysoderma sedebokerense]|nr:fatty acid desaturase-domain-containing protein [Paraphysoderma sedebokerense]